MPRRGGNQMGGQHRRRDQGCDAQGDESVAGCRTGVRGGARCHGAVFARRAAPVNETGSGDRAGSGVEERG